MKVEGEVVVENGLNGAQDYDTRVKLGAFV